jgi:hypothetical protein
VADLDNEEVVETSIKRAVITNDGLQVAHHLGTTDHHSFRALLSVSMDKTTSFAD